MPGAAVWVWTWNWSCDGAEAPPFALGSVTVCVACNLAVSIRVGSPGDSGDITQTTRAIAAVGAQNAAAALQDATQTRLFAPGLPPPAPPPPPDPPEVPPAPAGMDAAAAPAGMDAPAAPPQIVPAGEPVSIAAGLVPTHEPLLAPRPRGLRLGPLQKPEPPLLLLRLEAQAAIVPAALRPGAPTPGVRQAEPARSRGSAPVRSPRRRPRDRPERAPVAPPIPLPSLPTLTSAGSAHGTGGASVGIGIVAAAAAAAALDLLRRVVPTPTRFRRPHGGDRPERPG